MTFTITEEEQILYLVNKYIEKHKIRETEGEAIYQSEKAAEYAVALVADIADILSSESEVLDVDAIKSRAISHFGETKQLIKCIEELAELQTVLYNCFSVESENDVDFVVTGLVFSSNIKQKCKLIYDHSEMQLFDTIPENLYEEIGDVRIMISQIEKIFNCDKIVRGKMYEKLSRMNERILSGCEK